MRDRVCKEMKRLEDSPAERFLNGAVDCHLRASAANQKNRKTCDLCQVSRIWNKSRPFFFEGSASADIFICVQVHEDIELYEGMIFHFVKDDLKSLKSTKMNARETITTEENKKLEEKGVFLLQDQRKGETIQLFHVTCVTNRFSQRHLVRFRGRASSPSPFKVRPRPVRRLGPQRS